MGNVEQEWPVPVCAEELDAQVNPEDGYSWEIIEAADKLGLRTMTLSEAYGGLGTDAVTNAMVTLTAMGTWMETILPSS